MKRLALVAIVLLAVTEIPHQTPIPEDAYGIWQVPCISMSLPIYEEVNHNGQQLIDNDNSGCIWHYGKSYIIGDHAGSEINGALWYVDDMRVGCGAFLLREGKPSICYECTAIFLTHQVGAYYQWHGQTLWPRSDEIFCVSCAESEDEVYLAVFRKLGEMP